MPVTYRQTMSSLIPLYIVSLVLWIECISLQPTWKAWQPPQLYGPEINVEFYESNFGRPNSDVPPQRSMKRKRCSWNYRITWRKCYL